MDPSQQPAAESPSVLSSDIRERSPSATPLLRHIVKSINRHPVRWSLLVFSLALTLFGLTLGRALWREEANRPLGQPLPPFPTPLPPEPLIANTSQLGSAGTAPVKTVCDGPPQMFLLAVGSDSRSSDVRGLADVIRVVRVDFVNPEITALTIPRDLWVSIPGLGSYGSQLQEFFGMALDSDGNPIDQPGDYGRINVAYFYGNLYQLPGGGPAILSQTLYDNLGLPVEHYVGVDMDSLVAIIDAVGGIDIVVPYEIDQFAAGLQHMTGEQALAYSRIRYPDNDWYRGERQNLVLLALRDKLQDPQILTKVPLLIDEFVENVRTDLSKAQITSLICLANRIDREDIHTLVIGPELVTETYTTGGSFILLPDREKVQQYITEFYYGTLDE